MPTHISLDRSVSGIVYALRASLLQIDLLGHAATPTAIAKARAEAAYPGPSGGMGRGSRAVDGAKPMSADTNKLPAEVLVQNMALALEELIRLGQSGTGYVHANLIEAWETAASALSAYRAAYDASPGPALEAENARLREAVKKLEARSLSGSWAQVPATMRWAQVQRLRFIAHKLETTGRVNRSDLIDKFGISKPQASVDLRLFQRHNGVAEYDASAKCYVFRTAIARAKGDAL